MTVQLRIGEEITLEAVARDQDGRAGFMANTDWAVDNLTSVAGDPKTVHGVVSSSVANPSVITTSNAHGLISGDRVVIGNHIGSTPALDGAHIVTVTGPTTFTVPVNVTVGGSGGTEQRANATVVEVLDGPPPVLYTATLTGNASGAGEVVLEYDDPWLVNQRVTLEFTVLNASAIVFTGGVVLAGTIVLDYQDGTEPSWDITAVGVDALGGFAAGATDYVLTDFAWSHTGAHLSLTNPTSQVVTIEGASQGDGTLSCTAKNSAGVTISGSMPYSVLSTLTVVLQQQT